MSKYKAGDKVVVEIENLLPEWLYVAIKENLIKVGEQNG